MPGRRAGRLRIRDPLAVGTRRLSGANGSRGIPGIANMRGRERPKPVPRPRYGLNSVHGDGDPPGFCGFGLWKLHAKDAVLIGGVGLLDVNLTGQRDRAGE